MKYSEVIIDGACEAAPQINMLVVYPYTTVLDISIDERGIRAAAYKECGKVGTVNVQWPSKYTPSLEEARGVSRFLLGQLASIKGGEPVEWKLVPDIYDLEGTRVVFHFNYGL